MTSVAFKNYRRVIFWLLIATALILSYKFGADSVRSGSHDPYDAIADDCERAVYENKPDVVFKLSNQCEKTELKEFLKRKEDPSLRVWDDYRGYPYYRALAYEASGDYKSALKYLRFYWVFPDSEVGSNASDDLLDVSTPIVGDGYMYRFFSDSDPSNTVGAAPFLYDYSDSFYWLVEGRIRFKLGDRKTAFLDYCAYIDEDFVLSNSPNPEEFRNLITLKSVRGENPLSCFDSYSAFLKFVDEEYQNLDRPVKFKEKFKKNVEIFHAFENEETLNQYLLDGGTDVQKEKKTFEYGFM